ncbi:MAG TPA: hypothetical protein VFC63_10280 [Blastocatellia bacterium]|nr:hypothetical protein [Blastocatellia bacterium]
MSNTPKAPKIMIIRHAEKPVGKFKGVNETGDNSKHDLIVQGWQRAGALVCLFDPARGPLQDLLLETPKYIYASNPTSSTASTEAESDESKSNRPEETVKPLSKKLGININLSFSKGQETELSAAIQQCDGPVLVAWQHESIAAIGNAIPSHPSVPQDWPGDRFDMVFVFTLDIKKNTYKFDQVPQLLLAGDSSKPIS